MVKTGHIFNQNGTIFRILSNTDGMIVYRALGFPGSELFQDTRPNFEKRVEKGEFLQVSGRLISESRNRDDAIANISSKVWRKQNTLYKILDSSEGMFVYKELGFPKSQPFQDCHADFDLRIRYGELKENLYRYVEVGDIYILARTKFTYEILSIDRNAMVIKRFFKNEWKICDNYGLYDFHRKVMDGQFVLTNKLDEKTP